MRDAAADWSDFVCIKQEKMQYYSHIYSSYTKAERYSIMLYHLAVTLCQLVEMFLYCLGYGQYTYVASNVNLFLQRPIPKKAKTHTLCRRKTTRHTVGLVSTGGKNHYTLPYISSFILGCNTF